MRENSPGGTAALPAHRTQAAVTAWAISFTAAGLPSLAINFNQRIPSSVVLAASCRFYFLVGVIPWREISRSARSATPACSPKASRRIRSWHGWQMPPFKESEGFAQTIHFFATSLMTAPFLDRRLCVLTQNLDLLRILENYLQAVLRVVFNLTGDFNFFILKILRRHLILFE